MDQVGARATRLQQATPWAGIIFAILMVVGFFMVGDTPDSTDRAAWLEFHDDSGNRVTQLAGGYIGVLSAFVFLAFAHGTITRISAGRDGRDLLSAIGGAAATVFTVLLAVAMLVQVSISAAIEIGDVAPPESADLGIQFEQLAFGILLVAGCTSAAVFIAATSQLARDARAWPAWFTWAGFVSAVLLLFGAAFFPIVLIPLWASPRPFSCFGQRRRDKAGNAPHAHAHSTLAVHA